MSFRTKLHYENMVKRVGSWAAVRCMRNNGVSFEDAYAVMFGRAPR